ncbi:PepSY domain-containing protein [Tabrizicola soli]|uniref:PepSY domain-containing protein n=1 Tax=Tabrizicola soli TaxID=2185115 RepID=A0ABV7DSJ8_9RHOB|nr:PepSY domain-containing protein [Tabrizicola soli]
MKLKTGLMLFAAAAVSANMAHAAISGDDLAQAYLAQGYDYVEVKVGPTQTKVEAVKGSAKVEVVYDNETGGILKQEQEVAEGDDLGKTGSEITTVGRDFEDGDDDGSDDDEDDDQDDDDGSSDDHGGDDDGSDDRGDDGSDDKGGED